MLEEPQRQKDRSGEVRWKMRILGETSVLMSPHVARAKGTRESGRALRQPPHPRLAEGEEYTSAHTPYRQSEVPEEPDSALQAVQAHRNEKTAAGYLLAVLP